MKKVWILKNLELILAKKTRIEQLSNPLLAFEMKSIILQLTIWTYFSKLDEKLVKITENVNKNSWITSNILKNLSLDNFL